MVNLVYGELAQICPLDSHKYHCISDIPFEKIEKNKYPWRFYNIAVYT